MQRKQSAETLGCLWSMLQHTSILSVSVRKFTLPEVHATCFIFMNETADHLLSKHNLSIFPET